MAARVEIVGIWRVGTVEIRFLLDEGGTWQPDLFVDHANKSLSKPSECFVPTAEITDALDQAWWETKWEERN